jgi:hypothetical protein
MFSFLYHCHDFYWTRLYIWVTRRVFYKKQDLYVHVCRSAHVLFMLFVFACALWCPTHIVLCVCFVFLRLVYPMLPVSLDCPFLIAPSVFSNVYFQILQWAKYILNWFRSNHLGYFFLISTVWKQWKLKDHKLLDPCML